MRLSLSLVTICITTVFAQAHLDIKTTYTPADCAIKSQNGDKLAMHYTGMLADGKNLDRGRPFEFVLGSGQVIKGWDQGLLDMCISEKRTLTIPSDLAYGDKGRPPVIPEKATLIFEVELVDIKNRKAPTKEDL
ncbi:Peptidyl-prolyl cis-trans isomerase fpr2 [Tulasnella sp. 330]|nr:Peptidyl-prolyl cis-trans isomerase fpr2 [Tulasnella sp. 330]KAG8882822.1 Peptidyl-prolyl cis-trans isomerase fpr2 [Tulasnella sp. 332]KAG8884401.1 Peptidyl-prolyl cis-trans isomerase fpr2 [Tulasnella sp. 331]